MSFASRSRVRPLVESWEARRYARRCYDLAMVVFGTGRHDLLTTHVIVSHKLLAEGQGNDSTAHLLAGVAYDTALEHARHKLEVPEEGRFACQFVRYSPTADLDRRIDEARVEKESALQRQDFEGAATARDVERRLVRERERSRGV